jgi:hypothetical protein
VLAQGLQGPPTAGRLIIATDTFAHDMLPDRSPAQR